MQAGSGTFWMWLPLVMFVIIRGRLDEGARSMTSWGLGIPGSLGILSGGLGILLRRVNKCIRHRTEYINNWFFEGISLPSHCKSTILAGRVTSTVTCSTPLVQNAEHLQQVCAG